MMTCSSCCARSGEGTMEEERWRMEDGTVARTVEWVSNLLVRSWAVPFFTGPSAQLNFTVGLKSHLRNPARGRGAVVMRAVACRCKMGQLTSVVCLVKEDLAQMIK